MPFIFELIFGGALLATAVLLFIAGISARQNGQLYRRAIPLLASIASFSWIVTALIWRGALGPDYSHLQYSIIGLNLFSMLLSAIAAAAIRPQRSWFTVPAALILAFIWFYVGAIKSVA